jgi:hypothetical protein
MPRKASVLHVLLVKAGTPTAYYLKTDREGMVSAFKSVADAVGHYEVGYNRKHAQGFEGSMSACINSMFFQPAAISMTLEDLGKLVERDADGVMHLSQLSHVSGFMSGIPCKLAEAEKLWQKGSKPRLIS